MIGAMRNVALTSAAIGGAAAIVLPEHATWAQLLWPIESALLAVAIEWLRRKMTPAEPKPSPLAGLDARLSKIEALLRKRRR